MIQEHKLDQGAIHSAANACYAAGWHGIWEAAESSGTHHLGRSGGVAILAPRHVIITQGPEQRGRKSIHGMIQWTRRKMLHLFNIHAYDTSYPDRVESKANLLGKLTGSHSPAR